MKYCKKCTMPDTRPGITFDENGVCCACTHYEQRKNVDWDARFHEFEAMCDKYRGCNGPGGYDCAVAASGGKDSHFQIYMLKEVMGMNPIIFSVEDNFPMTEAGKHNLRNISEEFGCTIISCKPNIKVQKILMRKFFEKFGKPTWYVDRLIYTFPLHMASKFNVPFLCYGENVSFEYGGNCDEETYSARGQIENGVAVGMPMDEVLGDGVGARGVRPVDRATLLEGVQQPRARHVGVCAGCAQGAAALRAEEPIQQRDHRDGQRRQNEDRVGKRQHARVAGRDE